jgi:hypothetical protein
MVICGIGVKQRSKTHEGRGWQVERRSEGGAGFLERLIGMSGERGVLMSNYDHKLMLVVSWYCVLRICMIHTGLAHFGIQLAVRVE